MQLAADIAEPFDQGRFDVHVDIFALLLKQKSPTFDLSLYFGQPPHNLLAFVYRQQPDPLKHGCMGD